MEPPGFQDLPGPYRTYRTLPNGFRRGDDGINFKQAREWTKQAVRSRCRAVSGLFFGKVALGEQKQTKKTKDPSRRATFNGYQQKAVLLGPG